MHTKLKIVVVIGEKPGMEGGAGPIQHSINCNVWGFLFFYPRENDFTLLLLKKSVGVNFCDFEYSYQIMFF